MTVHNKVLSALRWAIAGNFLASAYTWGVSIYVIRLLEPKDYALMAIALVITGLATMLREAGMGDLIIQKQGVPEPLLRQIFGLIILLNLFFYVAIYGSAPFLAEFFEEPRLVSVLRILSLVLLIGMFGALPDALLRQALNFKPMAHSKIVGALAGSTATLIFAYSGFGVWSLVYGQILTVVTSTLALFAARPVLMMPSFRLTGVASTFTFGGTVTAERILWFLQTRSDIFIVGKVLGSVALGFYSVAQSIATMPMSKVGSIVNRVAFPAYSELQSNKALLSSSFLKAAQINALLFFPALWGISAIAGDMVPVVLGQKWIPAAVLLQIICLAIPIRSLAFMLSPALIGLGRPNVALRNVATDFVILSCALLIGTYWGTVGVCVAWLFGAPLSFTINLRRSMPIIGASIMELLSGILPTVASAVVMYLAVGGLHLLWSGGGALPRLLLSVALGVLVFGAMSFAFNRPVVTRATRLLRR